MYTLDAGRFCVVCLVDLYKVVSIRPYIFTLSSERLYLGKLVINRHGYLTNYRPRSVASEDHVFTGICLYNFGGSHEMHHGIGHMV